MKCQKSKTFERKFYGFKNIPNHFMQMCFDLNFVDWNIYINGNFDIG